MSDIAEKRQTTTNRERHIYFVTAIGSMVNLGLFIVKLFAGIFGMSSALIADAFHSLTDFITDIIVVVFVRLSSKPADKTHTYGHGKFETLATLFIGLSMTAVGIVLMWHAIRKIYIALFQGHILSEPGMIAFWAAIISIAAKELLFHYTLRRGKTLDSPAVVANAWHHRSDALSSICTALGVGGAILLGGQWAVLDPLAAAIVSIFIIVVGINTVRPCLDDLLEKSLPTDISNEITSIIRSVPGVGEPHHLLTRRIGTRFAIEFNMHIPDTVTLTEACGRADTVEKLLKERYGRNTHVGVRFRLKQSKPYESNNKNNHQ